MKKILKICLLITLFLPSLSYTQKTTYQLPEDQIKQFVQAIAVIKHYYIKKTTDKTLFSNAIRGMVSHLDPHSSYLDEDDLKELQTAVSGKFVGIGVELTTDGEMLKVISPLEGTPAAQAGIKANDLIIKVNSKLVQNMSLREAISHIKGKRGTKVKLTILRKNEKKPLKLTVTRNTIKLVTVKKKLLENNYGYIRITFFQGAVQQALKSAIQQLFKESNGTLSGLILDLRNNPGGLLKAGAQVANTFLDAKHLHQYHNVIVSTKERTKGNSIKLQATEGDIIPNVPLVVIINGGSASASEIVAGALQDYKRAVIIGTRSFGKGSVQTVLPISNYTAIKLTTALYHTPSGRVIQAQGILPDVTVPELTVSKHDIQGLLNIDESDYQNHLNSKNKINIEKRNLLIKLHKKEFELAKQDYQLYEALTILKSIHSLKYYENKQFFKT